MKLYAPQPNRTSNCLFSGLVALIVSSVMLANLALAQETEQKGEPQPTHAISMHGKPKLPADFPYFPYVNPDAPKGGSVTYGVVGNFNNTNPFILKGMRTTARGVWDTQFGNLVYETLMARSRDEPFSMYGLLAREVIMPDDRSWMEFIIDPQATWSDGKPVTAEDVKFTFELLRDKGRPPYSSRMSKITSIEIKDEKRVKFVFNENSDREFPLIVTLTPILPKHAINVDTFDQTTLDVPIGSGPYTVSQVDPGKSISFKRNPDYWAKDRPVKIGHNNFDTIRIEYFLQQQTLFESFRKGLIDVYPEGDPSHWQRAYDFPAVENGDVIKDVFETGIPANMLGFVFNTRKPVFKNPRVREALSMLFDFEWVNRHLFFDAYTRTASFWDGSNLSFMNHPASELEKEMLAKYDVALPQSIMDGTYRPAESNGTGGDRRIMRKAYEMLLAEGYSHTDGRLVDKNGQPLSFEILTKNKEEERISIAYRRTLERIGVDVTIRSVDDSQYQSRTQVWDYDMIVGSYSASLSPGAEQFRRWSSASASQDGSFNYAGAASPAIDGAIENLVSAKSDEDFVSSVRLLDRLIIAGHYVVPLYHLSYQWIAHWSRIPRPEYTPLYGAQLDTWWDERSK